RPALAEHRAFLAEFLPNLLREIWRERREHQSNFFEHSGHRGGRDIRLFGIQHVDQLHDGSDAGVEVPARLEIFGEFFYRLVELAEDGAVGSSGGPVWDLPHVTRHET